MKNLESMSGVLKMRGRWRRTTFLGSVILSVATLVVSLFRGAIYPTRSVFDYASLKNPLNGPPTTDKFTSLKILLQRQQQNDFLTTAKSEAIEVHQPLLGQPTDITCSSPLLFPVTSTRSTTSATVSNTEEKSDVGSPSRTRIIPPIIHMTSRVKCMTARYLAVWDQWQTLHPQYLVQLYDDSDVEHYFQEGSSVPRNGNSTLSSDPYWSSVFPKLRHALLCLPQNNGASKADLWRYLVLWDQGGVYTDIDNAPGRNLRGLLDDIQQSSSSTASFVHDVIIPINKKGRLSQFFILAAPRHPLLYLALNKALDNLLQLSDLSTQDASFVTGPFVLMDAMDQFQFLMHHQEGNDGNITSMTIATKIPYDNYTAGTYHISPALEEGLQAQFPRHSWMKDRTVTVVGDRSEPHRYVRTILTGSAKKEYYRLVHMQQWQTIKKNGTQHEWRGSCQSWLLELERRQQYS